MWKERDKNDLFNDLLSERIQDLMPELLKDTGIGFWTVISGEFNEDPVFPSLVPYRMRMAPRLLCFAFALDPEGDYHAWYFARRPNPDLERFYAYGGGLDNTILEAIVQKAVQMQTDAVAVDISEHLNLSDGISHTNYMRLRQLLPERIPMISAQPMISRWLETRTDREMELYEQLYLQAMSVIDAVYSPDVIQPGKTTTTDVEWAISQRIHDNGLFDWFAPDVDLQRRDMEGFRISGEVILPGDLVHCDMGHFGLGMCTDTQRNLYIGLPGEKEIPAGILAASKLGNHWQDILLEEFVPGNTGNQALLHALSVAAREGIDAMSYCHSVGFYGHGAGPQIGMFDRQHPIPVKGDLQYYDNTCHALECNIKTIVPEWGNKTVCIMQEETIWIRNGKGSFIDPARTRLYFLPNA